MHSNAATNESSIRVNLAKMRQESPGSLNKLELKSVKALVAYSAFRKNTEMKTIERLVIETFGAPRLEELRRDRYDFVVRFLVDYVSNDA